MRLTLPLLFALLALAACAEREPAPPPVPPPDSLAGVDVDPLTAPLGVAGPGEIVVLDTAFLGLVTVERGEVLYDVSVADGTVTAGGEVTAADRIAARDWLARFIPLRADGRYDGLAPQAVQNGATARLVFIFTDGSARTLAFQPLGDSLAVVSQDDGPVWRLRADLLDVLVPPAAALRGE